MAIKVNSTVIKADAEPAAESITLEMLHDDVVAGLGGVELASTNPVALGVAAPGNGTTAARSNHVHPLPTATDVGAVPTTRTLAGLDLSANRSAPDLRTALGLDAPTVTASNGDDGHGRWFYRARVLRGGSPVVGARVALRASVSTATALATAVGYGGTQTEQLPASGAYAATAWTWWGTTDADGYFGVALTPPSSVTVAVVGECEGVASTLTSHTFA